MNMIRTTIRIPEYIHEQIKMRAASQKISFNEAVTRKLASTEMSEEELDKKIKRDLAFFASLGKKLGKVNWTKVVREERDRDNA